MAEAVSHHLLSLPDDKIVQKLREMSLKEILKFSLISERCKDLVKSLRIRGTSFHVSIANEITILIRTVSSRMKLYYNTEREMYWGMGAYGRKKKLTAPQSISVDEYPFGRRNSIWEKNELPMQHWLKHLQDIFSYHKIDNIHFSNNSSQFDIDDLKKVFGNITEISIKNTGCSIFNQMILQKFFPLEKLTIRARDFSNSKILESIFMQNFDKLQIGDDSVATIMALDQLLIINSKELIIGELRMSAKQLNKLIKLWQSGSNPRMEYLAIFYTIANEGDKEAMMKDIKHEICPANQERKFKLAQNRLLVRGGYNIVRKDGVKATIRIRNCPLFDSLEMLVRFDHCVVEY